MFDWLRRRRRLSEGARRRLLIGLARAEESLIETHVRNALELIESVGDDLPLDRVLEVYLEAMQPGDTLASIVERRVLARLESGNARGGARKRLPG
ncbi:MAG: hypothetical protein HY561_01885 [Gemmatimonadetes bacterium]|nr:hypothetical protein [Gemmatimonadota bacterium]